MCKTGIQNEKQYEWAVQRVEQLLPLVDDNTPADAPECIELVLLSNMVADYSDAHYSVGEPTLADIIKLRMYEMGLSDEELSLMLGVSGESVRSLLDGRSEPTYQMARDISRNLNVDAHLVLGV